MTTKAIADTPADADAAGAVLLVANDEVGAEIVRAGLPRGVRIDRPENETDDAALSAVATGVADAVIIIWPRPTSEMLAVLGDAIRSCPRPVVLFTDDVDGDLASQALSIGVSSYVVGGLSSDRIQPLMKVALERFRQTQLLQQEVIKLRSDLEARKVIERAKGVVMARRGFNEPQAFDAMRRLAMAQGKPLRDVAAYVLVIANTLDDPDADPFEAMRHVVNGQDRSMVEIAGDIVAVSELLGESARRRT